MNDLPPHQGDSFHQDDDAPAPTVRILVCDDHPVVRAGIMALLDTADGVEVVGQASSGAEILRLVAQVPADLVLMDLQLSTDPSALQGAAVTAEIRSHPGAPHVLVLTNYDTDADIVAAIEAGAAGYLLKDAPPENLLDAIRKAAVGESALAPTITSRLMQRVRTPVTKLSPRELEVLEKVAQGASNAVIARELFLSETTVKSHLVHVFDKLSARSRTEAVAKARELGVIR
ncbi:MAG: response regulator transcription factor [Kocuria sp.]|nr:response regulator transcription factor [Kocuria sp.]